MWVTSFTTGGDAGDHVGPLEACGLPATILIPTNTITTIRTRTTVPHVSSAGGERRAGAMTAGSRVSDCRLTVPPPVSPVTCRLAFSRGAPCSRLVSGLREE